MKTRFAILLVAAAVPSAVAQEPKERPQPARQAAPVVSPEVAADRTVTFRVRASSATAVRLEGGHMPGLIVTTNEQSIGSAIDDILIIAEYVPGEEIRDQVVMFLPLR